MFFFDLSTEKKILYIESNITKDSKLRTSFRDLIIGMFSVEEYYEYIKNSSTLNKRIIGIVKERLISNVQLMTESTPTK